MAFLYIKKTEIKLETKEEFIAELKQFAVDLNSAKSYGAITRKFLNQHFGLKLTEVDFIHLTNKLGLKIFMKESWRIKDIEAL